MKKLNMKQRFLPIIVLSLVFALSVFADNDVSSSRKDIKEGVKSEIETRKGEIKDIRESMKDNRGEIRKSIAHMRVQQTVRIYVATANRLDKIVARIESRIAKISASGGDTTDIQTSLDLAKTKLAEARAEIITFSSIDVSSATSTSTAQTLFDSVKSSAVKAKESLKVAHRSLVKTIAMIRGIEKKVRVREDSDGYSTTTATTTNETNN